MPSSEDNTAKSGIAAFQKPKCLALMLCDTVLEDQRTHNKSLISLFNTISALKFPAIHARLSIMVSLCGGRGKVPIKVQLSSLEENKEIFSANGEAVFNDPLGVMDLVLDLRSVQFKHPGVYAISVYCGSDLIAERRFNAIQIERRPQ